MIDSSFDDQLNSQQQDIVDDLADFQEYQQERIVQEIMMQNPTNHDHNHLQNIIKDKESPQKFKPNEEQMKIKEIKLKNARKYFEIVKITYLQRFSQSLTQVLSIKNHKQQIMAQFMSELNIKLWEKLIQIKKIQPISLDIRLLLDFLKDSYAYLKEKGTKSQIEPAKVFWSLCQYLELPCRKVYFFDLQDLAQEAFYKLNYEQDNNRKGKKQNRKLKQHQKIQMEINNKIQQQKKTQNKGYLFLEDYQFDQNSFKSLTIKNKNKTKNIQQNNESSSQMNHYSQSYNQIDPSLRRQTNFLRNKNYKKSYFQLFSAFDNQWKTINAQILQIQDPKQIKKYILNGKCIIGFYSLRILHTKNVEYEQLLKYRQFQNIYVQDLTLYFYDDLAKLQKRRNRVGMKYTMRDLLEKGSFHRYRFLLTSFDEYVTNQSDKLQLQFQLSFFPQKKEDMDRSDYFITQSLLPKYSVLCPEAQPIEQKFNEQNVYFRKDLVPASSKSVWIQRFRKVKKGEIPVKKTQNKNKNYTELYLYEQTEQFSIEIDQETGQFDVDPQYKSIDIPPNYTPDPKYVIIENNKLGTICYKNKIRNAQVIQGFCFVMSKAVPNLKGYLIFKQDENKIHQLWQERQTYQDLNRKKKRYKYLMSLWTKLFTKIQLSQWRQNIFKK